MDEFMDLYLDFMASIMEYGEGPWETDVFPDMTDEEVAAVEAAAEFATM